MRRKSFYILSFGFTFSTLNFKFSLQPLTPRPSSLTPDPWPLTSTKDYVRKNILFMQNKPNFRKVKLNVTKVLAKDYDQLDTWSIGKNKAKTNPIQTQTNPIKANKTPKQTQFKPKQTQFQNVERLLALESIVAIIIDLE